MKKILTLILLSMIAFNAIHAAVMWTLSDDGTLTISGTDMPNYDIYNKRYAPWYSQQAKIKKVVIEDRVTNIGSYAFYECSNLTSITIPNSVTSIGDYVFWNCTALTSITIPESVTSIGTCALNRTKWYDNQPDGLVYAGHVLYTYKGTMPANTKLIVKDGTKGIAAWAFCDQSTLTSITLPESVTNIGSMAFATCLGLTSITVPNSVTRIYADTFLYCINLKSITIQNPMTYIDNNAFDSCSSLTSADICIGLYDYILAICPNITSITITIPDGETRIEGYAFSDKSKITSVKIPESVKDIGGYAFRNCSNLTSITIPNSVTSIGEYAFYGCSGLSSITIPNSVTNIGNEVFYGCSNLTSATINMKNITNSTFKGCSSLKSVTISNSVTSIGDYAFSGCSGLTSITIPNSVTSIGGHAFYECSKLASITIPESVTNIGGNAFEGTIWYDKQTDGLIYIGHILYRYKGSMPANTNMVLKDGTKGIAGSAFSGCSGLSSITIPNSVTSIGGSVFYGCPDLTSVTIGMTNIGNSAFNGCYSITSVTFLDGVTSIGSSAFEYCSGLTSITIPNSVTSIGDYAFYGCSMLKEITIGNSIESVGKGAFYDCYNLQSITIANPIPPSCAKTKTFECEKGSLRDADEIYNYANLHVPMGSKEAYSSAYEWRYFNKIKEDMEIDGNIYYAKLAVKQGTTGYTELPVKADETYTIYIGTLGNSKINAVTFNGKDVTDQVVDGYYTTPAIKAKSTLSISYEDTKPTYVKEITNPDLKVTGYEGEINISGIDNPTNVEVYSTDGKIVENKGSVTGDTDIQVKENELYLVKVGKRTIKIAM